MNSWIPTQAEKLQITDYAAAASATPAAKLRIDVGVRSLGDNISINTLLLTDDPDFSDSDL